MNALVVPTARPAGLLAFLEAWRPLPWDLVLIIEDGPEITLELDRIRELAAGAEVQTYSWAELDGEVPRPEIFSRRDSAIRAFGFWKAWKLGAETIFTLDDDCYPTDDDLVEGHLSNLERTPRWDTTVPGLRVRGLPYKNLGTLDRVFVSVGLWSGHPDLDAVQTLANGTRASDAELVSRALTRVLPGEQYFPLSGMNLAVRREAACLMYYPPMGKDSPYRRFDDIWCGLVLQRICRHLGLQIVCGRPLVEHKKASDPFVNLEGEGAGISANENIWTVIDGVPLTAGTPLESMREMATALAAREDDGYLKQWGSGMSEWCALFANGAG